MIHFVLWRKFRVEIPPPTIAMLKADENFIDELTSMSSLSKQHCNGGRGALAVKGSSLHTGKASFKAKNICPNKFCLRLSENGVTLNCCKLLARLNILVGFDGKQVLS